MRRLLEKDGPRMEKWRKKLRKVEGRQTRVGITSKVEMFEENEDWQVC